LDAAAPGVTLTAVNREIIIHRLRSALGTQHDVAAAYLFGSVARGEARDASDVDVAILFEHDPPATLDGLSVDLADSLQEAVGRPVDLLVLNRAPVDLAKRVLNDGVLLANNNPSRRIAFEVRTRNEYFDLEPFLTRYRRASSKPSS
jgi:predicted nucleotidyltransferase